MASPSLASPPLAAGENESTRGSTTKGLRRIGTSLRNPFSPEEPAQAGARKRILTPSAPVARPFAPAGRDRQGRIVLWLSPAAPVAARPGGGKPKGDCPAFAPSGKGEGGGKAEGS